MDARSEMNLEGVHPDLVKIVRAARLKAAFIVICGKRTLADEQKAMASGHSETLKSRHLVGKDGYAHAVDVVAVNGQGQVDWNGPDYQPIADAFFGAAKDLDLEVEWGGNWETLKDWGHFQLPYDLYPQ